MREVKNILYFGIYSPSYARNLVIIRGLKENGFNVLECNVSAKDRLWPVKLFLKFLKQIGKFDLMFVPFPGQEVMFLARLLVWRKPIIFDAFTSHYGGYILDRKYFPEKSFRAYVYRFLDKWSCRLADLVLLDTNAHIKFFVDEFDLPAEKFRRLWIGFDEDVFVPRVETHNEPVFRVLFFGTYIPVQGVKYIIESANLLRIEPIHFVLVGKGQDKDKAVEKVKALNLENVEFKPMLSPHQLADEIAKSDVCLGLFGDTPKTLLAIPNKVYESLAMKKAVITADTPAVRELFDDGDMVLVKRADGQAIAEGVRKLMKDPELKEKIANNGHNKVMKYATNKIIGETLKGYIFQLQK